jgi:ketosteroid isomerase-like protein
MAKSTIAADKLAGRPPGAIVVTPLQLAQAFVDKINSRDVDAVSSLMTEDHRFIDSLGNVVTGREAMTSGWAAYFRMVPDYRLAIDEWLTDGPVVVMFGVASGTYSPDGSLKPEHRWATPACIRAVIRGELVAEWRVYADNEPIRQLMRAGS